MLRIAEGSSLGMIHGVLVEILQGANYAPFRMTGCFCV